MLYLQNRVGCTEIDTASLEMTSEIVEMNIVDMEMTVDALEIHAGDSKSSFFSKM